MVSTLTQVIEKLLLRPREVAEAIGVGRSKTYQLIASGEIPSIRIGRSVRVPKFLLDRYIEERLMVARREGK